MAQAVRGKAWHAGLLHESVEGLVEVPGRDPVAGSGRQHQVLVVPVVSGEDPLLRLQQLMGSEVLGGVGVDCERSP